MLRAGLLAAAVCMDTFFAAMGCSMSGIQIPKRCAAIISVIGSAVLGASLLCGQLLATLLPDAVCRYSGAAVLILIGGMQLTKQALQALFRAKKPHIRRKALGLVIDICFDETLADADGSKILSPGESLTFAAALSLDSLASGMGAGIEPCWCLLCLSLTLVLGFALTLLGASIGKCCESRRFQWIGGVMLIVLAGCRLLSC